MVVGFLLQNSPQDRDGFEVFFEQCLDVVNSPETTSTWVFLRGDGVYQAINGQRLDDAGCTVPVDGGWKALKARGVAVYVSQRCAALRGVSNHETFLPGVQLTNLERFAELCLTSDRVVTP